MLVFLQRIYIYKSLTKIPWEGICKLIIELNFLREFLKLILMLISKTKRFYSVHEMNMLINTR